MLQFYQKRNLDDLLSELNRLEIFTSSLNDYMNESSMFNFDSLSLLNQFSHFYSCNLILGIDFTASNEWKGRKTFNSQSLHKTLANKLYNPYQKVISILSNTINKLINSSNMSIQSNSNNNKNTIGLKLYAYGFGDSTTRDKNVFSLIDQTQNSTVQSDLNYDENYFESFDEVLNRFY